MDEEIRQIISKQTGETDLLAIERTYYECNQDVGATVCKLMNITYKERPKRTKTEFDVYREIADEKDTIYQEMLKKKRVN